MFFSKKLKKFKNVRHCFFSRKNGFSKGFYESLNCGLGSNDEKENVHKNLELVSKKIGCKKIHIVDLDAAFGRPDVNINSIKKIRKWVS